MNVIYKCTCLPEERTIFVRDRGADEDVVHWVESVMAKAIGEDHREASPLCLNTKMEYAKIPVDSQNGRIGNITRH